MHNTKNTLRIAAGLLALSLAGVAHAGGKYHTCGGSGGGTDPTCTGETWSFRGTGTTNAPSYEADSSPSGVGVTATGYHQDDGSNFGANDTFTQQNLYRYGSSGLGLDFNDQATSGCPDPAGAGGECTPAHSFDNNSGFDLVVFQFDKAVTLSQIKMGWISGDADFSLFAWTPSSPNATPPGSDGFSIKSMADQAASPAPDGWTLIGSFAYNEYASTSSTTPGLDVEQLTAGTATVNNHLRKNVLDYASSYWAISAVVSTIAQHGAQYGSVGQGASDYFKIASLSGCYDNPPPPPPGVPEPMSAALLALGLAGLKLKRKRAQA